MTHPSQAARRRRVPRLAALLVLQVGCATTTVMEVDEAGAPVLSQREDSQRFASPYAYEWFIRAELLRAHGELAAAIEAYRAAQTSDADDPYLMARLATALDEHGQGGDAKDTLTEALELDPRSEDVWLARGAIAERHGDFAGALESYERAESAAPVSPRGPTALAALLRAHGSVERADAVIARLNARRLPGGSVATRRPDDAPQRLQTLLTGGRWAEAEGLLAMTEPAALGGITQLAEGYLAARRPDEALELARTALVRDAHDTRAQRVLVQATLALERYQEAAAMLTALLRDDPGSQAARAGLQTTLRAQGLPELAGEVAAVSGAQ